MVTFLSQTNKDAIVAAIAESKQTTSAELSVVIAPASDAYQSYFLLYALMASSVIDVGLWATNTVIGFPWLLIIQLAAMALFSFIPWLRHLCLPLVPKRIRDHRAAHRAYEEYLMVSHRAAATTPIVLLYISVAERYAHILTSRSVREKIPNTRWEAIINQLTAAIPTEGLQGAFIKAIGSTTEVLAPRFPTKDAAQA